MKILIFGGSGFLGSHVADQLSGLGHEVTIFDVKLSPYLKPNQKMIVSTMHDLDRVRSAVHESDVVYHFAGIADLNHSINHPFETIHSNVMGHTTVLEAVRVASIQRYVFASTVYVYSDKGSFYGVSKKCCEKILEEYHREFGIPYTILRYGSVYGSRSDKQNRIYRILKQALMEQRIDFQGDGDEEREYIHVQDAAKLSTEILSKEYENQHIILTGVERYKYSELLTMVNEILGGKIKIDYKRDEYAGHYKITPYSFEPQLGKKLVNNPYTDFGQGLLDLARQIRNEEEINPQPSGVFL